MKVKTPRYLMNEYDKLWIQDESPLLLCADNDRAKSKEILRKIEGVFQVEDLVFRKETRMV